MKPLRLILPLLYMIALIRPAVPFLEYAVNRDYIAEVLCINRDRPELACNGKCHLMKEVARQSGAEQPGEQPPQLDLRLFPWAIILRLPVIELPIAVHQGANNYMFQSPGFDQPHREIPSPPPRYRA